jgi:hypothetical protein
MAEKDPDFIRNMIKDNGDGTYTVYFYENGERIAITVDDTFPKGDDLLCIEGQYAGVSGQDKGELWPLVVEKAYAEWKGGYEMIDGGWPAQTFNELTGRDATEIFWGVPPSAQEQQLRLQELQTALANDDPIAVGMRAGFNGIDGNHAYSLRNIEGDQVHLYNPHGSDVVVSLDEFYDNCFNVAYTSI